MGPKSAPCAVNTSSPASSSASLNQRTETRLSPPVVGGVVVVVVLKARALARLCACLACEVLTRSGRTQRELLLLPPLTRLFGTVAGTPGRQYTAARTTTVVDIAMSTIISTAMSAAMSTVVYTVVDIVMVDIVMSTIIST
ncbi:unnamed protein product [Lampetra planeri]